MRSARDLVLRNLSLRDHGQHAHGWYACGQRARGQHDRGRSDLGRVKRKQRKQRRRLAENGVGGKYDTKESERLMLFTNSCKDSERARTTRSAYSERSSQQAQSSYTMAMRQSEKGLI